MSKERELLDALKTSLEGTSSSSAAEVAEAGGEAVQASSSMDLAGLMNFSNDLWMSISADPIFYFKVVGILLVTMIIIVLAFQFIVFE